MQLRSRQMAVFCSRPGTLRHPQRSLATPDLVHLCLQKPQGWPRAEACLSFKKELRQIPGCPGPRTHQVFRAGFASLAEDTKLCD